MALTKMRKGQAKLELTKHETKRMLLTKYIIVLSHNSVVSYSSNSQPLSYVIVFRFFLGSLENSSTVINLTFQLMFYLIYLRSNIHFYAQHGLR